MLTFSKTYLGIFFIKLVNPAHLGFQYDLRLMPNSFTNVAKENIGLFFKPIISFIMSSLFCRGLSIRGFLISLYT